MANYMEEAFAPAEAHYRNEVLKHTWGHLAPVKGIEYRGHIVFAVGCYDNDHLNPTVLECGFKDADGDDLDDSPWFYDAMTDFLGEFVEIDDGGKAKTGGVYRWDGTFRNFKFRGKLRRLKLS